eukprot:1068487-Alexandrium_andersonii.AAC.1
MRSHRHGQGKWQRRPELGFPLAAPGRPPARAVSPLLHAQGAAHLPEGDASRPELSVPPANSRTQHPGHS